MNCIAKRLFLTILAAACIGTPVQKLCAQTPSPARGTAPAPLPSAMEINALIAGLADRDFQTRDTADKKLRQMGWAVMSSLIVARQGNTDAEVHARLTSIMEDLCWSTDGLSADSTTRVNDARLSSRDRSVSQDSIVYTEDVDAIIVVGRALAIVGPEWSNGIPGGTANSPTTLLQHIAQLKRQNAWSQLEWELICSRRLPDLLLVLQDRPADIDRLLPAIEVLRKSRPAQFGADDIFTVALTQSAGKSGEAFTLAHAMRQNHYEEQILAEQQDWTALAKFPANPDFFNVSRFIPAAALLFTGNTAGADAIIGSNSKAANGVEPVGLQRQVVLLGRIDLINEACEQRGDSDTLVDFLLRERRYALAMQHHSQAGAPKTGKDAWSGGTISAGGVIALGPGKTMDAQLDSRLLLALVKLNEVERAKAEIHRLKDLGATSPGVSQGEHLLGISPSRSATAALATSARPGTKLTSTSASDLARQFGDDYRKALPWCELALRDSNDADATYEIISKLLSDKLPAEEVMRLATLATKPPADSNPPWYWWGESALTDAPQRLERIGRHDLAVQSLNNLATALSSKELSRKIDYRETSQLAVEMLRLKGSELPKQFFDVMARQTTCDPTVQFLAGVFAARQGDRDAGDRLRVDANLLLGGDIDRRVVLIQSLCALGENELAKTQAETVAKIGGPVGTQRYTAHEILGEIDQEQNHFADALQHYRLAFFAQFYDSISIPEPYEEYFHLPRNSAYCESRAALEKSDRVAALRAAIDVINLDPEGLDLTIQLINAFKQANLPNQAKSLATLNRNLLLSILKDFPNSHLHHYLIAKLDLATGTNDQTQFHLDKALQLAPTNFDYQKLRDSGKHLPGTLP